MVVPVPCLLSLLLKFETKMSPGWRGPPFPLKSCGTKATPYGFWSPFGGTVEIFCGLGKKGITGGAASAAVEKAEIAAATQTSMFIRRLIQGHIIFVVRFAGSICLPTFFINKFSLRMIDVLCLERTILAHREES